MGVVGHNCNYEMRMNAYADRRTDAQTDEQTDGCIEGRQEKGHKTDGSGPGLMHPDTTVNHLTHSNYS